MRNIAERFREGAPIDFVEAAAFEIVKKLTARKNVLHWDFDEEIEIEILEEIEATVRDVFYEGQYNSTL